MTEALKWQTIAVLSNESMERCRTLAVGHQHHRKAGRQQAGHGRRRICQIDRQLEVSAALHRDLAQSLGDRVLKYIDASDGQPGSVAIRNGAALFCFALG